MEMTIAIQKADYNSVAQDRITMTALRLGFSLVNSGQQNTIKFFGVDSISKISTLARRIKQAKRDQEKLTQFQ